METSDRHGQTPLNLAARHGYADVVRVFLVAGARADHADCDGWTALRAAAWGGHIQVLLINMVISYFQKHYYLNFHYNRCNLFIHFLTNYINNFHYNKLHSKFI